ncbi:cytidine deaminase [Phenylobacterium sp.]|uniref:cytidine deaminase n=1 Tax=Phenylobacterium sp. TaxID=1871053 RepID=UPI002F404C58
MTDASKIADDLRALLARAHAPYSGVQVACAVEGADGSVHLGVNVENAAYPQGWCAEASAIGAAVSAGTAEFARVYVASSLPGHVWPCGGCRQKIFELARGGCEVVSLAPDGTPERRTIEALLPLAFRLDPATVRRG